MHCLRVALLSAAIAAPVLISGGAQAQDATAGERLFRQRCGSCHSVQEGQNRVGPHLFGVIGRPAASVEGARYSPALRDSGLTWDAAQIEAYITNPRKLVPRTTMSVSVPNASDRAGIVAYLQSLTASN